MYRYLSSLENTITHVIRDARLYFPASATQEMLDEFRPYLCPLSCSEISFGLEYLEMFLPICVKPDEASISYELWFKEFMDLWETCNNGSNWEMVNKLAC